MTMMSLIKHIITLSGGPHQKLLMEIWEQYHEEIDGTIRAKHYFQLFLLAIFSVTARPILNLGFQKQETFFFFARTSPVFYGQSSMFLK